jgi:hypothetical protein
VIYDSLSAFERDYGVQGGGISVDRIGKLDGDYLALMPDGVPATFEERSLPIYNLTQPYSQYNLAGHLPPDWSVEVSEVAPAFGRPGGGIQILILDHSGDPVFIPELRSRGLLR